MSARPAGGRRGRLEDALRSAWRGERPVLSAFLVPAGWLYAAGAGVNRGLYRLGWRKAHRAVAPVISVGNLVVGGAGKTPVTLELARRLLAAGRRVAVLSRGYGRRSDQPVVVVSDGSAVRASVEEGGDEPVWLAHRLPGLRVVVAAERFRAADVALELGADLLLLDDGFSHRALARDAEVVVVDAQVGLGNGRPLPAGPLREPPAAAAGASLLWLTRCEDAAVPPPLALEGLPLVRSRYLAGALVDPALRPAGVPGDLAGKRVLAVCGIARPESFERTLDGLGAVVRNLAAFPDHHRFTAQEAEALAREADAERCEYVITTEKDILRLPTEGALAGRVRALRMETSVLAPRASLEALLSRFAPVSAGEAA